ncbi:MAG: phage virion morphogenesis protein, partial [Bacteroidales bacterium]
LQSLPQDILSDAAEIVAETATEYFKSAFRTKSFDGNPWAAPRVPKKTGSLLIDSGALVNSIRPVIVSMDRVVISAGNEKVDYAQIHNEGDSGSISVPEHTRRTKKKDVKVRSHTRNVNIPQREFMGNSKELNSLIYSRIEGFVNSINK